MLRCQEEHQPSTLDVLQPWRYTTVNSLKLTEVKSRVHFSRSVLLHDSKSSLLFFYIYKTNICTVSKLVKDAIKIFLFGHSVL